MMIMQNLSMSRESRKLLTNLDELASKHNTSTIVTIQDVFMADQLVLQYYIAPVFNVIRNRIKSMKKVSSENFTVKYWIPIINKIFKGNTSVRRDDNQSVYVDDSIGINGFELISKYLATDYSLSDAEMIQDIVCRYRHSDISNAIHIASKNNVYNIRYINAILEKEQALSNMKKQEINNLRQRADNSNAILNQHMVQHSVTDMATNQYNWQQMKDNADLERRLQEKLRESR